MTVLREQKILTRRRGAAENNAELSFQMSSPRFPQRLRASASKPLKNPILLPQSPERPNIRHRERHPPPVLLPDPRAEPLELHAQPAAIGVVCDLRDRVLNLRLALVVDRH